MHLYDGEHGEPPGRDEQALAMTADRCIHASVIYTEYLYTESTVTLPLSALDFHVLVALADADLYGYALMKAVDEQSGGVVSPEIGSLYRVLARLAAEGLVEDAPTPADAESPHPGRPRRYYRLTDRGRGVARDETARLQRAVSVARAANLTPGREP